MNTTLLDKKSLELKKLSKYIIDNNIYDNIDISILKNKANIFYSQNYSKKEASIKNDLKSQFKSFSPQNFINDNFRDLERNKEFKLMTTLSLFRVVMINKLSTKEEIQSEKNFGTLKRQVSPPLEAYEHIGHNKLDINPTGRSYGLLFE